MLKYSEGQEFNTNRETKFPEGYDTLEVGAIFKIKIAKETCEYGELAYPYLVRFENGFEISLDEKDIEELTRVKEGDE
ncbi:membrane-bound protein [Bacillus phage vB_BthM-Goe5]|nr:membrane-bound protein [Bacillus phage vB_BthM-Goe5]